MISVDLIGYINAYKTLPNLAMNRTDYNCFRRKITISSLTLLMKCDFIIRKYFTPLFSHVQPCSAIVRHIQTHYSKHFGWSDAVFKHEGAL